MMDTLYDLLREFKYSDFWYFAVAAFMVTAILYYKLNKFVFHPRVRFHTVFIILISSIPLFINSLINSKGIILLIYILIGLLVLYSIITIWFPFLYEWILIQYFFRNAKQQQNFRVEYVNFFISTPGKLLYLNKLIKFYSKSSNDNRTLSAIESVERLKLFRKEEALFDYSKSKFYWKIGAIFKLKKTLENSNNYYKGSKEYLFYISELSRFRLDVEDWRLKIVDLTENKKIPKKKLSSTHLEYNNLAVANLFLGNLEGAKRYLLHAKELLQKGDIDIHIIYPNLIDNALLRKDEKDREKYLTEYKKRVDMNNREDVISWFNYIVQYYRQKGDGRNICATIYKMEDHISNNFKLTETEQANFKISNLKMKFNGKCLWQNDFAQIASKINYYLALPDDTAYLVANEMLAIMWYQENGGKSFNAIELVINSLVSFLVNYLDRLSDKIDNLRSEFVYERCNLLSQKASIIYWLAIQKDTQSLESGFHSKMQILNDIVRTYVDEENRLEELKSRMIIIKEVDSLSYASALARIDSQRITKVQSEYINLVKEQVEACWQILKDSKFDPVVIDDMIMLAYFLYKLFNDFIRSKTLYDKVNESGISLLHYNLLLNQYYSELDSLFKSNQV